MLYYSAYHSPTTVDCNNYKVSIAQLCSTSSGLSVSILFTMENKMLTTSIYSIFAAPPQQRHQQQQQQQQQQKGE